MTGTASAPASSANLGPGFDCIALALELDCTVTAAPAGEWDIQSGGEAAGEEAASFLRAAATMAAGDRPLRIEVTSEIPRASGLGSSAALAAATAAAAARAFRVDMARRRIFEIVSQLDGHCDNAAATVFGGLVAVVEDEVIRLELSDQLIPVVAVPPTKLSTREARQALPETISHAAAARNTARVVGLVEGLRTANRQALARAAGDELHENYRAKLSPTTADLMEVAMGAGALHASWSGAGPTVLAFVTELERDGVVDALSGAGARVMTLAQSVTGLT